MGYKTHLVDINKEMKCNNCTLNLINVINASDSIRCVCTCMS